MNSVPWPDHVPTGATQDPGDAHFHLLAFDTPVSGRLAILECTFDTAAFNECADIVRMMTSMI
jgi:hypothetical protein